MKAREKRMEKGFLSLSCNCCIVLVCLSEQCQGQAKLRGAFLKSHQHLFLLFCFFSWSPIYLFSHSLSVIIVFLSLLLSHSNSLPPPLVVLMHFYTDTQRAVCFWFVLFFTGFFFFYLFLFPFPLLALPFFLFPFVCM